MRIRTRIFIICLFSLVVVVTSTEAQEVYTIKADSTKLTGCDSNELIIENHTQAVKGFLYNTGNGRTIFKKGVQRINDTSWIIGGDTLHAASWLQGGNRFGATGKLGTLDYDSLKFYTAGMERAWIAPEGDAHFNGNLGIGSATVTAGGNLINTNAILFQHFVPRYHNYLRNSIYLGRLDDIIYNYQARLNTTSTLDPDGTLNVHIVFPPDEIDPSGIVYPGGWMYFSFWNNGLPQSVSVIVKDRYGNWTAPSTSTTNLSVGSGLFAVPITLGNWLKEIKVTIVPQPGGFVNLQNMEYVLATDDEGLYNPHPYVSKYNDEHIYNFFYLKNGGVDNVRISPFLSYPNFFKNKVLIGGSSDVGSGNLQVTGNVTATGIMGVGTTDPTAQLHTTGTVRFAGLTSNNVPTRVVVGDADGNLYYRDASSLSMDDVIHSSLAVNGPVRARSLTLQPQGSWPDYVFDKHYRLPDLSAVAAYARKNGHLPDIPSAGDVAAKGVDVGTHEAILLKKIEELTLYAAQQAEQIRMMQTEIKKMKVIIHHKRLSEANQR